MARLFALGAIALALFFGGASAVQRDAHDAWHSVDSTTNTMSNNVTNGIVNLHNNLPPSNPGSGS